MARGPPEDGPGVGEARGGRGLEGPAWEVDRVGGVFSTGTCNERYR
jgi:hypothetical protein